MEFNNVIGVTEVLSILGAAFWVTRKITHLETVVKEVVIPRLDRIESPREQQSSGQSIK